MIKSVLFLCIVSFVSNYSNAQEEKEKYQNELAEYALASYQQSSDTINEVDSTTVNLKLGERDIKKIFKRAVKIKASTKNHFQKDKPYSYVQIDHYWIVKGHANWWKPKYKNIDGGAVSVIIDARNGAVLMLEKQW